MRRKLSFTALVERRIADLRKKAAVDTQYLRNTWIVQLDSLFVMAMSIAKGRVDEQEADDTPKDITPKERQMWAHVAAHCGEVMCNLAKGFDERQFNEELAELERQVDEIDKLQAQDDRTKNPEAKPEPEKSEQHSDS
jgi:hypothetical protein